jgi:beta-glucosidase
MLRIQLLVENTGGCSGSEVIQAYVAQRSPSVKRPRKELKGFKKQYLGVGESKVIEIDLETRYATSFWDEERSMWISEKDTYEVLVGNSSTNTSLKTSFEVKETLWWSGV